MGTDICNAGYDVLHCNMKCFLILPIEGFMANIKGLLLLKATLDTGEMYMTYNAYLM
jgi:hypothetical protein